jgi:hypothetical protein
MSDFGLMISFLLFLSLLVLIEFHSGIISRCLLLFRYALCCSIMYPCVNENGGIRHE